MKVKFFKKNLESIIALLIAGILMLVIPTNTIIKIIFIILGLVVILTNLQQTILGYKTKQFDIAIVGTIYIALGVVLMFYHGIILLVLLGIFLIGLPLYRIFIAADKKDQFYKEIFKIILGIILLVLSPEAILGTLIKIIGVVLIVIAALLFVSSIYTEREVK